MNKKVEDTFTQQRTVKSNHKLQQPQASRPSPPVSPACPDLSTKPKPKGVPSTAIPLVPAVSTRTRHPPPVPRKPIMLSEQYKLSCTQVPILLKYNVMSSHSYFHSFTSKRARASLPHGSQARSGLAHSLHLPETPSLPAGPGGRGTYTAGGKGNGGSCDVTAGTGRLGGTSFLEHSTAGPSPGRAQ